MVSVNSQVVFIGGSGRAGTNLLKRILSEADGFYGFPFESRYIIDPDGIVDFISSYENNWSPYNVARRIDRLECLLTRLGRRTIVDQMSLVAWRVLRLSRKTLTLPPVCRMGIEQTYSGFQSKSKTFRSWPENNRLQWELVWRSRFQARKPIIHDEFW